MTGFRHILFPVDFSERCRSVRPFVESMTQQFRSKLTLCYVINGIITYRGRRQEATG
jgi:hypothetical protein